MKLRTLIADDEQLARQLLCDLLAEDPNIEVVGECKNGLEVAGFLKERDVDLLFLDVQMPGATGFDLFSMMGVARMPSTVFVTAHTEFAVQAFDVHAVDYLTKPIQARRLHDTLQLVRERIAGRAALITQQRMYGALESVGRGPESPDTYLKRLVVPDGQHELVLHVADIDWIEAADYYSCIHVGPKSYMLHRTTKDLASSLDPRQFVRIHRSAIVNLDKVKQILREGRSEFWVTLSDSKRLRMSKNGWQDLMAATRG